MRHRLLAGLVIAVDAGLAWAAHPRSPWLVLGHVAVAALVVALVALGRAPVVALGLAFLLTVATGGGHVVLLWTSYRVARTARTRARLAMVIGAAAGAATAHLLVAGLDPRTPFPADLRQVGALFVAFVGVPLLAGRYVAQHDRLVDMLRQRNRELRGQRELVAEQERLRERLRIARDMHDSLGQRLSLVSVQAAALEVSDLPAPQRVQIGQLAQAARVALAELHELIGALRREPAHGSHPGLAEIGALVDEFVGAGVAVTRHEEGPAGPVAGSGGQAAYRVVQEGLTNAARHAPGAPVTVRLRWEPDALLVTVTNPAPGPARPPGHGLTGLAERVELAGGLLEHRHGDDGFRLVAMVPTLAAEPTEPDDPTTRRRSVALAVVTAVLMFVVLPAGMLVGAR